MRPGRRAGLVHMTEVIFREAVCARSPTQLTHLLIGHLTILGAVETLLLLLAMWWAWTDTAQREVCMSVSRDKIILLSAS
jgi:hypothetical protein